MTGWNLPPGCTTADIDRAAGGDLPEAECGWCDAVFNWMPEDIDESAPEECGTCMELDDESVWDILGFTYREDRRDWRGAWLAGPHPETNRYRLYLNYGYKHLIKYKECGDEDEAVDWMIGEAEDVFKGIDPGSIKRHGKLSRAAGGS